MAWPLDAKETVIALTVGLTLIVAVFYGKACRGATDSTKKFDIAVLVEIAFNSASAVVGAILMLSLFAPDLQKLVADSWLFVFISGLVVTVVSGMTLGKRAGWLS